MKTLIFILLIFTIPVLAQEDTIPSDFGAKDILYPRHVYNLDIQEPVNGYDCYLEMAKDIDYLIDQYFDHCEKKVGFMELYEIIYWDGSKFDTIYANKDISMMESFSKKVKFEVNEKPSFVGFREWLKLFIKSFEK